MRTVLVTGALGGIGRAIVERFLSAGYRPVLTDLADAESARAAIEAQWSAALPYYSCDVSDEDELARLTRAVDSDDLAIDILVNNAGTKHVADIRAHDDGPWHQMLAVNATAPFQLIRHFSRGMVERGFGRIVNMSSVIGITGSRHRSGYIASKHALVGLTRGVALDLAGTGVTCNAVCPGWVDTDFNTAGEFAQVAERLGGDAAEAKKFLLKDKQPDQRLIPASEVAEVVAYFASDSAASVTGLAFPIDGGWTAQ